MAKILFWSDIHVHTWKNYAKILDNGLNSRLVDGIKVIKIIEEYAVEHDIDLILFTGDLFHIKKQIYVQSFNAAYSALKSMADTGIPLGLISGNHDQADKYGTSHSLHAFKAFCTVMDTPGWVKFQGCSGASYDVLGVPYTEDVDHLRSVVSQAPKSPTKHRIFAGHLGIQGAKVGADFVYNNPHDPTFEDLNQSEFDFGAIGHFHLHQQVGANFWYVGAPMQHTWGDRGDDRGFLVWDSETNLFERILIDSPKFVEITDKELLQSSPIDGVFGNFVRIVSNRVWNQEELSGMQTHFNSNTIEAVLIEEETVVTEDRLGVSPQMDQAEIIQSYVKSGIYDVGELNPDYLIKLGKELVENEI